MDPIEDGEWGLPKLVRDEGCLDEVDMVDVCVGLFGGDDGFQSLFGYRKREKIVLDVENRDKEIWMHDVNLVCGVWEFGCRV